MKGITSTGQNFVDFILCSFVFTQQSYMKACLENAPKISTKRTFVFFNSSYVFQPDQPITQFHGLTYGCYQRLNVSTYFFDLATKLNRACMSRPTFEETFYPICSLERKGKTCFRTEQNVRKVALFEVKTTFNFWLSHCATSTLKQESRRKCFQIWKFHSWKLEGCENMQLWQLPTD